MILGLPRSRTAWLANFFTTEKTFCFHEPLAKMYSYREIESLKTDRITGLADTGLGWFDLSIYPCKKVIIHRAVNDVNRALKRKGMSVDMSILADRLKHVDGLHIEYEQINERLPEIWQYCTNLPYDELRGEALKNFNVQVLDLPIDEEKINSLRAEITC